VASKPVHPATQFRQLLKKPEFIGAINVYDPLTARIAQQVGFKAVALGGYQHGTALCVPEPTLTMTEVIEGARLITKAVTIPLKVDCGAGFGEAVHVTRTIREVEAANIACIHIEDQFYPKRAHYHKNDEQIIPIREMIDKLKAAVAARTGDLVICGRTDACRTHGAKEAIRRGEMFMEAGCDMVELFPSNMQETILIGKQVKAPLVYVNATANLKGRPVISWNQLEDLGYKMCLDASAVVLSAVKAVRDTMRVYQKTGLPPKEVHADTSMRSYIESLIGLDEYYEIEERTLGLGKKAMKAAGHIAGPVGAKGRKAK
jgi:methylisocitrate lyase